MNPNAPSQAAPSPAAPNRTDTQSGFTLVELMIVVAIMGLVVAFAIPGINRYQATETAKSGAAAVASALREARTRALKEGVQYVVILNPDTTAAPPAGAAFPYPAQTRVITVARIVRDNDGNRRESVTDIFAPVTDARNVVINVNVPVDVYGVRPYNSGTDQFNAALEPPPNPTNRTLGVVNGGNSFFQIGTPPGTPVRRTAIVVFNNRGFPVDANAASPPGGTPLTTGAASSYYVTDGRTGVFAAVLGPLGEVRVQALDIARIGAAGDQWR